MTEDHSRFPVLVPALAAVLLAVYVGGYFGLSRVTYSSRDEITRTFIDPGVAWAYLPVARIEKRARGVRRFRALPPISGSVMPAIYEF